MATKNITDLQVVQAYQRVKTDPKYRHKWPYEVLMDETGQPFKVCYRACERADKNGLIEFGVSLNAGWLTEKGKQLLQTGGATNEKRSQA